jgi:threonine dehydrogenase-like Zn-dependent dehydrogenase
VGIGRIHYGMTRWIGSRGARAADSYAAIPVNGEIRPGERIAVIGAGGPMGQMHIIRALCLETQEISLVGTDVDDLRLEALLKKAGPLAEGHSIPLRVLNTGKEPLRDKFTYFAVLVPVGAIVADAINQSLEGCLINIFAGIPAVARHELDLDTYIANRCFMFGTSGSVIEDMRIVLNRLRSGRLDTNCSVDAIAGMAGAAAAMAAVETRALAGKIIVYPGLREVGLVPLGELKDHFPSVGEKLDCGRWTKAAEVELMRVAGSRASG